MARAPLIGESTRDERLLWVRETYACIADCDQCGFCASFHGRDPERAFADYIDGRGEFVEVSMRARR